METKRMMLFVIGAIVGLGSSAIADEPTAADKTAKAAPAKSTKPAKMTCEEFIALDDVAKPKVIYWAEGFSRKGKAEDAVFDIEATDRLVPVLVDECTKAPKESFWKKVKAEFKKIL